MKELSGDERVQELAEMLGGKSLSESGFGPCTAVVTMMLSSVTLNFPACRQRQVSGSQPIGKGC